VIDQARIAPRKFAIEYHVLHVELRNRSRYGRARFRQAVTREKSNVASLPECQQANPVELLLEDPLRTGEARLRQRRRHRLNPFGKTHERNYDLRRTLAATLAG